MICYKTITTHYAANCQEILTACFETPWKNVYDILALEHTFALGAFDGEKLIGFIIIGHTIDTAEILNIAVLPRYQNRGIATELMIETIAELKIRKADILFLEVSEHNTQAIRLYTRLNFQHTNTRKAYYAKTNGTYTDAYIMELNLNN